MSSFLIIIDFDMTLTRDHTHNVLAHAIWRGLIDERDVEGQWQQVKHIKPTGSAERWRNLFSHLLAHGHHIAIASFSAYPAIIHRYLREIINLDEKTLGQIFIESWLPEDPHVADKNLHIANVIQHFNFQGPPGQIVLIDDSQQNCEAARTQHYQAIEVNPGDMDGIHIESILNLSKKTESI